MRTLIIAATMKKTVAALESSSGMVALQIMPRIFIKIPLKAVPTKNILIWAPPMVLAIPMELF